ncbi:MAG: N-acetylmuramoyl-L-alanine amidase [Bacteroidota bacterium]
MIGNRFVFAICFGIFFLLSSFHKNNTEPQLNDKFVVVLDAGHGGHDPGNLGNGYLEKNIALSIVLKTGEILETHPDIKVIYTRKDDTFVDLFKRGEIANQANADLFVSVHCDSHTSNAYGAGTFVLGLHKNKQNFDVAKKENSVIYLEDNYEERYAEYDINSPESIIGLTIMQEEFLDQSIQVAKLLQDNFTITLKRKDRKVKQAGFIVLHQTFMPSILVETGFLTNKDEGAYLNSQKGQQEMGTAIANAILRYKEGVATDLEAVQPIQDDPLEKTTEEVVKASEQASADTSTEKTVGDTPTTQQEKPPVNSQPVLSEDVTLKKAPSVNTADEIVFKVQLMASSKVIPLEENRFNGLKNLSKEPYKNMYRYMFGNATTYAQAKQLKSEADTKGYTTSYIVAYKNGQRIPLKEGLKYSTEQ